uniref:Phosphatidate cytidylyltransferase n=1 Tax=Aegilops tauschii subsp. strangulata TaxID=200361 RepID=A0A453H6Q2_AEGTS
FTLVVSSSSVSIFLFGIFLFMVLISSTRDFRERTKSKLVKIMIWAGYHLLWVLYYLLRGIFRIVQAIYI